MKEKDLSKTTICVYYTVFHISALNQEAARRQAAEQSERVGGGEDQSVPNGTPQAAPVTNHGSVARGFDEDELPCYSVSDLPPTEMKVPEVISKTDGNQTRRVVGETINNQVDAAVIQSIQDKMTWAVRELAQSQSVEHSKSVCELIKTCAETLQEINKLQAGNLK